MATGVYHPAVRGFIRDSLATGWSGRQIYGALPSLGLPSYHRETFFKVVKGEREYLKVGKATKEFAGDIPFDRSLMVEEDFLYPSKYRISGKVNLYDEETDEVFDMNIQFYDDENRGKNAWDSEFMDRYEDRYEYEGYSVVSIDIDRVSHQPGFRY